MAEVKALLAKDAAADADGGGRQRQEPPLPTGGRRPAWTARATACGWWNWHRCSLTPSLVPQAVAGVLGVKETAGKTVQQSLVEWLRPRRLLLILDNCEHLVVRLRLTRR